MCTGLRCERFWAQKEGATSKKRWGTGKGFGASPPSSSPPASGGKKRKRAAAATLPNLPAERTASLEKQLASDHEANCTKAAELWATCDDGAPSAYSGGWEAFPAPSGGVSPGNAPYGTDQAPQPTPRGKDWMKRASLKA